MWRAVRQLQRVTAQVLRCACVSLASPCIHHILSTPPAISQEVSGQSKTTEYRVNTGTESLGTDGTARYGVVLVEALCMQAEPGVLCDNVDGARVRGAHGGVAQHQLHR